MPQTRTNRSAALALIAGTLAAAGCQVYDFEPVSTLAVAQDARTVPLAFGQPKPNVMLLVDKSGSMGSSLPSGLSKMQTLKDVMNGPAGDPDAGFLVSNARVARFGMSIFPAPGTCAPTTTNEVLSALPGPTIDDSDTTLDTFAASVRTALAPVSPGGSTPTAGSVGHFYDTPENLDDARRSNFILLLTDGLPNCNASLDQNTCVCSSGGNPPCSSANDCLDDVASASQILRLREDKGIDTIVVGFGADTNTSLGYNTLEAMAEAGGVPRKCPNTNGSCGPGNDCILATGKCTKQFFQAVDGPALAEALAEISKTIGAESCVYNLVDVPSDPRLVSVVVNGTPYLPGVDTWIYDPTKNQIVFKGALCDMIKNNTPENPVRLDIRLLKLI